MKSFIRSLFAGLLAGLARMVLHKYKPTVVMVTGSVGKTSTKDAVAAALGASTHVRASEKSYNSEFGVPLTVLGVKNPWANPLAWLGVFREALALIILPNVYPKLLVLEVGADRPGDLSKIMKIGVPDAVVVTRLPDIPVHVEAYASTEAVRAEEFTPAFSLPPGAPLILASSNDFALSLGKKTLAKIHTFGFAKDAEIFIETPGLLVEKGIVTGMEATAHAQGKTFPLIVHGALGRHQLLAPAAAIATALSLGYPLKDSLRGLSGYIPPAGRARILQGLHGSLLIDDSYNSSPAATEEALRSLGEVSVQGKRVAVLGDMLELGRYSAQEHARMGILAAGVADVLVTVGQRSRATLEAAREAGLAVEHSYAFDKALEAIDTITGLVSEGDVVLVKGSQGVRVERVVEALLGNKSDAYLLVRQDGEWKRR